MGKLQRVRVSSADKYGSCETKRRCCKSKLRRSTRMQSRVVCNLRRQKLPLVSCKRKTKPLSGELKSSIGNCRWQKHSLVTDTYGHFVNRAVALTMQCERQCGRLLEILLFR